MESKAKLFGHPIHPMLIVFPLGLFIAAVIFDILYLATGNETFSTVAFYNIAGGVLGGLLAAVFGLVDYLAIPGGTRAKGIGTWHLVGNLAVVALFALSWFVRRGVDGFEPPALALAFSFIAAGLGAVTAWLGGELVDRLGVGVDPGANLDAPSSLTGRPARAARRATGAQVPVTGDEGVEDEP
jgi:uncharacterized membrane protein